MTWMVGDAPYGSYAWMQCNIGSAMSYGGDPSTWNHEQISIVDSCIQSGLRRFYSPPPVNDERHMWSFLMPTRTLTTSNGDNTYDLPEDFAGNLDGFTFSSNLKIAIIKESELRAMQAYENASSAAPKYAAIRPKLVEGAVAQSWEVILYPTPNNTYTLSYSYQINPPSISEENQYPYGGSEHAETILESCLAIAETRFGNPDGNIHQAAFLERLAGSVLIDNKLKGISGGPWEVTEPAYSTYGWLLREASGFLFGKYNPDVLTTDEDRKANSMVLRGLRQFYNPPLVGDEQHIWSFMMVKASISAVADDYAYDLPADFGTTVEDITYTVNGKKTRIEIIPEGTLRAKQAKSNQSGAPVYAAIRPKSVALTAEQAFEIVFFPTPEQAYTIDYRYNVIPADATSTSLYPLGTRVHAETILASVLACCELQRDGKRGDHYSLFTERLGASILVDSRASGRRTERIDNQGRTDNVDRS